MFEFHGKIKNEKTPIFCEKLKVFPTVNITVKGMGKSVLEEDEEFEKIRQQKLREMQKKKSKLDPYVTDKPIEVTDSNFEEVIKKYALIVIDCWAAWCAPCRMISPIIEELAKDYAGKITFGKLNVDQNRNITFKHHIMSIPTILVFKEGELVDRVVGAMPKKILESRIISFL